MVTWGSPATVTEKLVSLRDEVGHFGTLTVTAHEWDDPTFCKRSMTLLAEDVMPSFAKHAEQDANVLERREPKHGSVTRIQP